MEDMSKKKSTTNYFFWLKLASALLFTVSFLGLLGAFGLSIGKYIDNFFTITMGSLAWTGPFLCFIIGLLLWVNASKIADLIMEPAKSKKNPPKNPMNFEQIQDSSDIPLPAGKIVSLKGFNQYFSSPEWVELKDKDNLMNEEMKEIGTDFPSYFGTGKSVFTTKRYGLTSLKGLNNYFTEVDKEASASVNSLQNRRHESGNQSNISTEKREKYSPIFKTKTEQEEFLAQYKEDCTSLVIDSVDSEDTVEKRHIAEIQQEVAIQQSDELEIELESNVEELSELIIATEYEAQTEIETNNETNNYRDNYNDKISELTYVQSEVAAAELILGYSTYENKEIDSVSKPKVIEQVTKACEVNVEELKQWEFPGFDILDPLPEKTIIQDTETSMQLEKVLFDFGVKAKLIRVTRGPVITRYELAPAPGVKISKIVNLSDDIALALAARDVRIEAPIPGKAAIGIEVPNKQALSVVFREVLETPSFKQHSSKLKVALGKDISDQPIIADLIKMPHLLVAGATGSGKSVCITTIINSILFNATPDEVKLLLVDPKMVELSQYNGIPHLLAPVVIDPKKAASALKWIVKEMENRYELFAASGVRDIERYNRLNFSESSTKPALPFVVVIIDELADLMMVAAGEVEEAICRLAQMARAAGIHLVIATQRPSVDVITGVIKANIPSRISFAVSSQIDSRTILDATGAEKLLGRGDMLYSPLGQNKALRVQGCLVTDDEVQRVIMHWKGMGKPEYLDPERLFAETTVKSEEGNGPDDALFIDAGQLLIRTGMASVSFLQRRLKLGYTRAARLMDMLEEQGVVGGYEGSKPRQVLITLEEFNERFG